MLVCYQLRNGHATFWQDEEPVAIRRRTRQNKQLNLFDLTGNLRQAHGGGATFNWNSGGRTTILDRIHQCVAICKVVQTR